MSPGGEASVGDKVGGDHGTEGQDLDWDIKMEDMEVMKGDNKEIGDFTWHSLLSSQRWYFWDSFVYYRSRISMGETCLG